MTAKPWIAFLRPQTMHCSKISPLSALECNHAPTLHDCGASANNSMPAVPSVAFWSANARAQLSICRRLASWVRSFATRLTPYAEFWIDALRSENIPRQPQSSHYHQRLSQHSPAQQTTPLSQSMPPRRRMRAPLTNKEFPTTTTMSGKEKSSSPVSDAPSRFS